MGYFTTFLICHLYFRHRSQSLGYPILDALRKQALYGVLILWAGTVCYSRLVSLPHAYSMPIYHHKAISNIPQRHPKSCGAVSIGVLLGSSAYAVCELLPIWYPHSLLGKARRWLISSDLATLLRIKDGWSVWKMVAKRKSGRPGDESGKCGKNCIKNNSNSLMCTYDSALLYYNYNVRKVLWQADLRPRRSSGPTIYFLLPTEDVLIA